MCFQLNNTKYNKSCVLWDVLRAQGDQGKSSYGRMTALISALRRFDSWWVADPLWMTGCDCSVYQGRMCKLLSHPGHVITHAKQKLFCFCSCLKVPPHMIRDTFTHGNWWMLVLFLTLLISYELKRSYFPSCLLCCLFLLWVSELSAASSWLPWVDLIELLSFCMRVQEEACS